ncbi:M17 family metallopeptidase [Ningiella sp. W23]|uniref:M17 family metallopeptidase n=1 Tax=Ningiella sp. W23 TaxID=3023715 RepID=UPI003756ABD8
MAYPIPKSLLGADSLSICSCDLTVIIGSIDTQGPFSSLIESFNIAKNSDPRVGLKPSLIAYDSVPGKRFLHVPVGNLNRDYDDVRRFFDLGKNISSILLEIEAFNPLLTLGKIDLTPAREDDYQHALENVYLGICQGLWQPLEAREARDEKAIEPVESISLFGINERQVKYLNALEAGKRLARDLCGTEPERMSPIKFAEYCQAAFSDSVVSVDVIENEHQMLKSYPCLHAVARASLETPRQHPRIIQLTYEGENPQRTLFLAGKGITYDTGGADLKVNGHMAGMSRDKGGAAGVAGIMQTLALLKPTGIKVVASIAAVRNSIGADAYVPDEIITSHAGVRVRVGNTDAEGRMVLTDVLSHLREQAVLAVNPQIFSVATLTGHAAIAFGPYTALLENQQAIEQGVSDTLIAAGHQWSDPCEQSRVRREDYDFIKPRSKADDVLSSNNAASVGTVRGHQFPMAFLSIASGIESHNASSESAIAYTHVDIAGSGIEGLDWQHGKPTAAPVAAFVASYVKPLLD